MIPKILHFIWVGDESKRPDNCIQTWIEHHPDWQLKIWGNDSLADFEWVNAAHMRAMSTRELNGVADMMRWEILYNQGGLVFDADSICVRKLDDELLDCEAFACWESEIARPGLIAAGYFGCAAGNPFVGQIILDIKNEASVIGDMAWKTVGPMRLTESFRKYQYHGLRIYPSHYFIPEHFSGVKYQGPGPIYAHQEWASTRRTYDQLHLKDFGQKLAHEVLPADGGLAAAESAAARQPSELAPAIATAPAPDPSPVQAARPKRSVLAGRHAPYFVQQIPVGRDMIGRSRLEVFAQTCANRRVLHMGCADWPITDPKTSLHLALEGHCARLDGFDIHAEALDALRPHTKGRLFSRLEDVTDEYDLILVPEVMEHVPDVGGFLAQLHQLQAPHYLITVPDAFQCHSRHFEYLDDSEIFVEVVHPDQNCWYTPYTLSNVITKYTPWQINGMWFFNQMSLLTIASKR